ncbi:hypothetical protein ABT324_28060 [Saccharopolyspora sp. NPDC000359]|uniref:hypothetical protein n=1 Tax=Saccharopolyspora sp. NPDC000359 TaxID=3154251 RepID=UPI00332ABD29
MEQIFTWLLPSSMLGLGGRLLLISFVLQLLTPQNSKAAIWLAVIGGFGVGGGAGGWLGQRLAGATTAAASFTERWTAQLVGTGFGFLIFLVLFIFVWKYAGKGGSGLQSKGKSKVAKVKQIAWLLGFALAGTAVAGLPEIYGWADGAIGAVHSGITAALPS